MIKYYNYALVYHSYLPGSFIKGTKAIPRTVLRRHGFSFDTPMCLSYAPFVKGGIVGGGYV